MDATAFNFFFDLMIGLGVVAVLLMVAAATGFIPDPFDIDFPEDHPDA